MDRPPTISHKAIRLTTTSKQVNLVRMNRSLLERWGLQVRTLQRSQKAMLRAKTIRRKETTVNQLATVNRRMALHKEMQLKRMHRAAIKTVPVNRDPTEQNHPRVLVLEIKPATQRSITWQIRREQQSTSDATPQAQLSKDPSNSSGEGGTASGGTNNGAKPTAGNMRGEAAANLEYTKKTTDLALDFLDRQRDQPDPEFLKRLGWTEKIFVTSLTDGKLRRRKDLRPMD